MERIESKGDLIAVIVKKDDHFDINFVSSKDDSLQVGVNDYPKGSFVAPHAHRVHEVILRTGQEMVHIDEGIVTIDLYDKNDVIIEKRHLYAGDTIFFVSGGHAFFMDADTRIVETKLGPYRGRDIDKRMIGCGDI